jgi:hypothetical protein
MIFVRKIVIFHTKYPKNFHAPPCKWKKYDISHEIPQIFSRLPPQLEKILFFGVKS